MSHLEIFPLNSSSPYDRGDGQPGFPMVPESVRAGRTLRSFVKLFSATQVRIFSAAQVRIFSATQVRIFSATQVRIFSASQLQDDMQWHPIAYFSEGAEVNYHIHDKELRCGSSLAVLASRADRASTRHDFLHLARNKGGGKSVAPEGPVTVLLSLSFLSPSTSPRSSPRVVSTASCCPTWGGALVLQLR